MFYFILVLVLFFPLMPFKVSMLIPKYISNSQSHPFGADVQEARDFPSVRKAPLGTSSSGLSRRFTSPLVNNRDYLQMSSVRRSERRSPRGLFFRLKRNVSSSITPRLMGAVCIF